jgi:hypothetical protein
MVLSDGFNLTITLTICPSGNIMLYPVRTILETPNGNKEVPAASPARLWFIRGKDML